MVSDEGKVRDERRVTRGRTPGAIAGIGQDNRGIVRVIGSD